MADEDTGQAHAVGAEASVRSADPLQLCRPVGQVVSSKEEAICGAAADVNSG